MASDMVTLRKAAAGELCAFLERALPALAPDWWPRHVVNALSPRQQRAVEQRGIRTLWGLDLAALLRVLHQNGYDIGRKASFDPDASTRAGCWGRV